MDNSSFWPFEYNVQVARQPLLDGVEFGTVNGHFGGCGRGVMLSRGFLLIGLA